MGITTTRLMTGLAGVIVAAALGVGTAAGQAGTTATPQPTDLDASCVLDRQYVLASGGECTDIPDWFRALVIRSDALNRLNGLGPYATDVAGA